MMRDFNLISRAFLSDDFSLSTVSELIVTIRSYRYKLTQEQISDLLDIPINILEEDVELKNATAYLSNGHYFAGNITVKGDSFLDSIRLKFENSPSFDLVDIIDLTKYIRDNISVVNRDLDFILRNTEVTLRDDVHLLSLSNFQRSGRVFAKIIDAVLGL